MTVRFHIIGYTIGVLLTITGFAQLIPALVDTLALHSNGGVFFLGALTSLFFGFGLIFAFRCSDLVLSLREMFLLTALSWLSLCFFGAIPFYISDLDLTFVDAFFEASSGITTTGSTVLTGLDDISKGILIWRSLLQWIGGIGIIAFAILLLPLLNIGGMQIFKTESSDSTNKMMPRTRVIIFYLILVYAGFTAICAFLYNAFGMSGFDAVNHAMTTVSTGGYSTHDASFAYFDSRALELICVVFMILASLPFMVFVGFVSSSGLKIPKDEQIAVFLYLIVGVTMTMTLWLWMNSSYSFAESLFASLFNVVSIVTTTGYATHDYTLWGAFSVMVFFFLTYCGGCSGSTSGGVKITRLVIVIKAIKKQLSNLIYPHGVFAMRYSGRSIDHSVTLSVFGFLGVYVTLNVFLVIGLCFTGVEFATAVSAAATAIANVGPGVGEGIGPSGTFQSFDDTAKYLLSGAMVLGRLEILPLLVLLSRQYWSE